jgi:hypothetical protein
MLKQVHGETRALVLMQEIDAKRAQLDGSLQAAAQCRKLKELASSVKHAADALCLDPTDPRVLSLVAELRDELLPKLETAFVEGRLDIASNHLELLRKISSEHESALAMTRALTLAMRAWRSTANSDFASACDALREVMAIFPKAKWIGPAIDQIDRARDAMNELRSGALGSLATFQQRQQTVSAMMSTSNRVVVPTPQPTALPARFILQVDGGGSFLVFRQASVTVGPVSSSRVVDLGLVTEPSSPIATIARMDEDYFIRGNGIAVNDQAVNSKLLCNGDRISLGVRSRVTFQLPSPASTTAVLDLTGTRMPRADIRHAILLYREIVLSPEKTAHVRVEHAVSPLILLVRNDQLFVETKETIIINGTPSDRENPIPTGAHVRVGNISFIVTNA